LAAQKKPEEAKALLVELKTQEHLGRWESKIYIELRYICSDLNDHKAGLNVLQDGLKKLPNNEELLRELAYYHEFMKDDKSAEEAWRTLINVVGDDISYNRTAIALERQNKSQDAIAIVEEGLKKHTNSSNLFIRKGFLYANMDDYKNAVIFLQAGVELFKKEGSWWSLDYVYDEMAHFYDSYLNDAINAIKYYELAIKENPNNGKTHSDLAALYTIYSKNYEKALEYFNIAIAENPDDEWEYYVRGMLYRAWAKDDPTKGELAKADFLKAKELCTKEKITYHSKYRILASSLIELGDLEEALGAIKAGQKLEKTDGSSKCFCLYQASALYYFAKKDYKAALKNMDTAISLKNSVRNDLLKKDILAEMDAMGIAHVADEEPKKGFFAKLFGK